MQQRPYSSNSHRPRSFHALDDMSTPNPISYSGTQVNIYGAPKPDDLRQIMGQVRGSHRSPMVPPLVGAEYPYGSEYPAQGYTNSVQLGLVTEHMLRKLDESRLMTMSELMRRAYGGRPDGGSTQPFVQEPPSPRRSIEYGRGRSPARGGWQAQIDHISSHLMEAANDDRRFRKSIEDMEFGELMSADLEESSESISLILSFSKPRSRSAQPISYHRGERDQPLRNAKPRRVVTSKVKEQIESNDQSHYEKENVKQDGTVKPYRQFNAEADAETLRKAMKGIGTDESALTTVLAHRTNKQRQEIIRMYKTLFGKDLVKDLKSELSGDYWKTIRALCMLPADYDANELRNAIKGMGTDDATVIEIICTRTNKSLQMIREAYKRLFGRSLEEDLADDTSGHYQRLLVALLQSNRDESGVVDRTVAVKDAKLLYEAGAKRWGTDESRFNAVLVARGAAQLRATFAEVQRLAGKTVEEMIKAEMSGDLATGLLTVVRCMQNKPGYFAKQLYKAMKGLGTEDDSLIRIIVSRSEVDLVQIKQEFQRAYNESLSQFVADDTSGDYQKVLLSLLGESNGGSRPSTSSRSRASVSREIDSGEES